MNYCPECSARLDDKIIEGVERKACPAPGCGFVHWENPVPVVAALVQHREQLILARNVNWPVGRYSLITGYLERNETPAQAVLREVKEELGLEGVVSGFIGCYSLFAANQVILAMSVTGTGVLRLGEEIAETILVTYEYR
jgi:NAD+ diphosphatase